MEFRLLMVGAACVCTLVLLGYLIGYVRGCDESTAESERGRQEYAEVMALLKGIVHGVSRLAGNDDSQP